MLGPLEWYVTPTLDAALLICSRAGADLGQMSDRLESDAFLGERERLMLIEKYKTGVFLQITFLTSISCYYSMKH